MTQLKLKAYTLLVKYGIAVYQWADQKRWEQWSKEDGQ